MTLSEQNTAPHSLDAEASVLGAVLLEPEALDKVLYLKQSDFYNDAHKAIWRAITYLHNNDRKIDFVTVSDALSKHHRLESVGGAYYITGLAEKTPTTANIASYASIVKERSIERQLQEAAYEFYATPPEELNGTVQNFQRRIEEIMSGAPDTDHIQGLALHTFQDYITDETEDPAMIIEKGILPERGLMIIGGQPKAGKSILSLNIAYHLTTASQWLDFPVPEKRKALILQAENSYFNIRRRIKTMHNATALPYCLPTPDKDKLTISDPFSLKINDVKDYLKLESLVKRYQPEVLIFDPLVYFHSVDENSNAEMGLVMEHFRTLANNHDIAVILVHHSKKPGIGEQQGGMSLRGASAVFGAVDTSVVLARHTDPHTADTNYTLDFDLRNGENPERMYLDFDQSILWLTKTEPPLPNLEQWIMAAMEECKKDGVEQKHIKEVGVDTGFNPKTIKNKIALLIKQNKIKTDGQHHNRKLYHAAYFPQIEL